MTNGWLAVVVLGVSSGVLADPVLEQGRDVFMNQAQPACSICHTLKDAGAAGQIGPNLDVLAPTQAQVVSAVTQGVGVMPAFSGALSAEQIDAVAYYVSQVSGGN